MNKLLQEYDVVRIAKLVRPSRDFTGTQGVSRPPIIGDQATICHQYVPHDPEAAIAVEMTDQEGMTIWLADFIPDELELVSRSSPRAKT